MKKKTLSAKSKKESNLLQKRIEQIMAARDQHRLSLKPVGRIPKQHCS